MIYYMPLFISQLFCNNAARKVDISEHPPPMATAGSQIGGQQTMRLFAYTVTDQSSATMYVLLQTGKCPPEAPTIPILVGEDAGVNCRISVGRTLQNLGSKCYTNNGTTGSRLS